jgi:hypothetical protein
MKMNNDEVVRILKDIAQRKFLTKAMASDLEVAILEVYPDADDDDRFENVLHMLASYEPDGGDYLYNEKQLREECKRVLMQLRG